MENINEQKELLNKLMNMLEKQFSDSEIVLHDFTQPYEHTIADIRNGHITGRRVGDSLTNFGLEVVNGEQEGMDRYNYVVYTASGTILRSSSMYITNSCGKAIGALCINTDVTNEIHYQEYLRKKNQPTFMPELDSKVGSEIFPGTVQELLEHLIKDASKFINKEPENMTKEDKIKFLDYLDKRGAFLISKSGDAFCSYLGISKFTMYKYLDMAKEE